MPPFVMLFLTISVIFGSILIGIIIHEVGHLVSGLLTGYQFSSFRIFSWMWYKDGDKIKFTKYNIPGTGGQCLMIPVEREGDYPYFWYLMGGGLANLLLAVIFMSLSFVLGEIAGYFLWLASIINFSLFLLIYFQCTDSFQYCCIVQKQNCT